jgi:hypothetical protein
MPGRTEEALFSKRALRNIDSDIGTKISHDRYEVYVNGDFIGHKMMLTKAEDITDVNDFLRSNGFTRFTAYLNGDQYHLKAENHQSKEMMNALNIYLMNR